MANKNKQPQQKNEREKARPGDTSRTSSQGRKKSSGGRKETDNQGRPDDENPQNRKDRSTGIGGKIM